MCCSRTLTAICAVEQQLQQRHKSQPLLPLQDVEFLLKHTRGITSSVRALSVMIGEAVQNADDITDRLKMKELECDRFLRAIAAARGV